MKTFRIVCICVLVSGVLVGQLYGEIVSVDMETLPGCSIDATLSGTATYAGVIISCEDSNTATVTGNITADLGIFFDEGIPEVADVNSIRFTDGQLHFSDMSFTLDFGVWGAIGGTITGLGGSPDSPLGPGAVVDGEFDCTNHVLILNQGVIYMWGSGFVGGMFEPLTVDLAEEQMVLSLANTGSVSVALESLEGNEAAYSVTLILPVYYDMPMVESVFLWVDFAGAGVLEAHGSFVRSLCPLRADLAGEDCSVDEEDLAVFIDQWLVSGDVDDCGLSADLYGEDCYVDVGDFAVMANEWLRNVILND